MTLLACERVTVAFGGLRAVDDVTFAVPDGGGVTAVIGPNGAGKTTLFNLIFGVLAPTRGRVVVDGHDITGETVHRRAALGMARTFQNLELFEDMTVREHVLVGGHLRLRPRLLGAALRLPAHLRAERAARVGVDAVLERLALSPYADVVPTDLPYGLQRRVEIARALAGEPRLVLLDEPMAGLSGSEAAQMAGIITELVHGGLSVLLVEHHMETVMRVSDRVIVMNFGRVIADGSPAQIQRDPDVIAAYLGDDATWSA